APRRSSTSRWTTAASRSSQQVWAGDATDAASPACSTSFTHMRAPLIIALVFLALAAIGGYAVAAPRGPTPTITSGPSGATSATTARFAFAGARGDTFECALDAAAFAACASPKTYAGLRDGAHTFRLRERTRAGQLGDPVTRGWTVDTK